MNGEVSELKDGVGKRLRQDGGYRFVIVYRDRDGRQVTETLAPGHNRKTARLERNARLAEAHRGVAPGMMTLSDFLPVWDASIDGRLQPQTVHGYRGLVKNHLKPAFGRQRLRDLRPSVVQSWLDRGAGRDLSPAMQRKAVGCLSVILKAASVRDLAEAPAFDALTLKAKVDEPISALSVDELERIVSHLDAWYQPDVRWLAYSGVRRGEHHALLAADVDLGSREARIHRTIDRFGNIGATKNPWSTRTIQLTGGAAAAVRAKLEQRLAAGVRSDLLWTTRTGRPMSWPNFHRDHWKPAITAAGLPDTRVHDLRHTYASLAIAAGLDLGFISAQLGHKNTIVTQSVYQHWLESRNPIMVDRFDQAYNQAHE